MTTTKNTFIGFDWGKKEPSFISGEIQADKIWIDEKQDLDLKFTPEKIKEIIKNAMNPPLEGFEQVIGRKFTCHECERLACSTLCRFCKRGLTYGVYEDYLLLSDDTKAEIKLKDQEIADTKIDTHPRHKIGQILFPFDWFKLELIL